MIYREFKGKKLSMLGLGTMRLPLIEGGSESDIDEEHVQRMVDYSMEHGVNYFDTAYGYHNGNSEVVTGKALAKYPREIFYVADKFPGYDLSNMPKIKEIFAEQKERTGFDYFDFYMLHNVCEMNIEQYLDPQYGIMDFMREKKASGEIKHIGFSAHARVDVMRRFLEAYGDEMEFCQIQLNYLDWILQEAKEKVELLNEYNIPIWVMEPLRGGRLAKLSDEATKKLAAIRPDETVPGWAFRFLQSVPNIKVILSGMSNMEQLEANIATFEEDKPLNDEEQKAIISAAGDMYDMLPCTACHYCTSHCPQGLDIPEFMFMYNELRIQNGFITSMALGTYPEDKRPSACIGCRQCEAVCPQEIKISEIMADFVKRMDAPMSW